MEHEFGFLWQENGRVIAEFECKIEIFPDNSMHAKTWETGDVYVKSLSVGKDLWIQAPTCLFTKMREYALEAERTKLEEIYADHLREPSEIA